MSKVIAMIKKSMKKMKQGAIKILKTSRSWSSIALAVGGGFMLGIVFSLVFSFYLSIPGAAGISLYHDLMSPQEYFDFESSGEYVVVDLRSKELYAKEHLKNAVSVPVKIEKGVIENEDVIVDIFQKLDVKKTYILLGENSFSRIPYLTFDLLCASGVQNVRVMNAGWNEIRHLATFWLTEGKWNTFQIEDHIIGRE